MDHAQNMIDAWCLLEFGNDPFFFVLCGFMPRGVAAQGNDSTASLESGLESRLCVCVCVCESVQG